MEPMPVLYLFMNAALWIMDGVQCAKDFVVQTYLMITIDNLFATRIY
jgi:hypothetical protein